MESSKIMRFRVMEFILGMMVKSTQENGSTIKCTEKVLYGGQMARSMKDSLKMIREMAKDCFNGKMVRNIEDHGSKENSMV